MLRLKRILAGLIDLYISYICILGIFTLLKEPIIYILQDLEMFIDISNAVWYASLVFKDIIFKNASLGKKVTGIEIVSTNDNSLKTYKIILRNILLPICYPFEFISILFFNKRIIDSLLKIKIDYKNQFR